LRRAASVEGGETSRRRLALTIGRRVVKPRFLLRIRMFGDGSGVVTAGAIFLIQALVVIALPVVVLRFSRLKGIVPLVVVQIVVGIALGPSLFGRFAPETYRLFFNAAALTPLSGIGAVALLVFGLITGLHVDPATFRGKGRAFTTVAVANIAIPTALGTGAGFWILARHPEELLPGIRPVEFAVAVGICGGMVALPVLGAILREMNLLGHRIGHLALAIAGVNDTVLWIILGALLTGVAGRQWTGGPGVLAMLVFVPVYLFVMVWVVRPLLGRMIHARLSNGEVGERALAVIGGVTIASALATEAIGLHYILGAFVTGLVIPDHLRKPILGPLQGMTGALLMPFFSC
jgi:Kef-type K+ transport system membrane component KefB